MRKLFLLATFLIVTPVFFVFSLILIYLLRFSSSQTFQLSSQNTAHVIAYAALPTTSNNIVADQITLENGKAVLLKQFFLKYNSPLADYTQDIINDANKYSLDDRLLAAIAMTESGGCLKAPANSYNCWGFGIYGKTVTRFDSYPQAIDIVSKTLAEKYAYKGLTTPEAIMSVYDPPSAANGGKWARSVEYFMSS